MRLTTTLVRRTAVENVVAVFAEQGIVAVAAVQDVAERRPEHLVVLDGDPFADVRNLAKVVYTIRAGQVIYQKP